MTGQPFVSFVFRGLQLGEIILSVHFCNLLLHNLIAFKFGSHASYKKGVAQSGCPMQNGQGKKLVKFRW